MTTSNQPSNKPSAKPGAKTKGTTGSAAVSSTVSTPRSTPRSTSNARTISNTRKRSGNHPELPKPTFSQWRDKDYRADIDRLLQTYGRRPAKERDYGPARKPLSGKTKADRAAHLKRSFALLQQSRRGFDTLSQLTPKYASELVALYTEAGLSPASQVQYFGVMRWFWKLHGATVGCIKDFAVDPEAYVMHSATRVDRGVAQHAGDVQAFLQRARQLDERFGWYCQLAYSAGLRRNECLCLRPHENDQGTHLQVFHGAKGGRPRTVDLTVLGDEAFAMAREAIDALKRLTNVGEHAAWSGNSLEQNRNRFKSLARKLGFTKKELGSTFHGLRHDYTNNGLEFLSGEAAPVRGGLIVDYRRLRDHQKTISAQLGHNRPKVTTAYTGSFREMERRAKTNFIKSWALLEPHLQEVKALMEGCGVEADLYFVGARATGTGVRADDPFELMTPFGLADEAALQVARVIGAHLSQALAVPVIVSPNLQADPAMRAKLMERAYPLFAPKADAGHTQQDDDEQAPEAHINREMRPAGPRQVKTNYRLSTYKDDLDAKDQGGESLGAE